MVEKKQESFTVTDRRLFTSNGEVRSGVSEEEIESKPAVPTPAPIAAETAPAAEEVMPDPPTDDEQKQQADAYSKSSKELDARVELSGHSSKELDMASLYMTAMLQLGLMHEQGAQPRVDLIGARQTIDTLSLISDKTKGNLTPAEVAFLQNSLYELRMAYVEVTNALARPPQTAIPPIPGIGTR